MKKILLVLMCFLLLMMMSFGTSFADRGVFALSYQVEKAETEYDKSLDQLSGKSKILIESSTGEVIYENKADDRHPIASMCKIMTLLLTFEDIESGILSDNDLITVSETAAGMGGSQAFLECGGQYFIRDLIKSVIIASANDSAVALAERLNGNEDAFVSRMNERAAALGLANTLFANCTGLPKPMQYSCARDVAVMLGELIKHKSYFDFSGIWMDEIKHGGGRVTGLTNTNKLSRFYVGCDGGKTGYTSEAGHCLAATASRSGLRLISVVIGADSSKTRFAAVSKMFDFGFANYKAEKLLSVDSPITSLAVAGGKDRTVTVLPERDYSAFFRVGDNCPYSYEINLPLSVKAPIKCGDVVGKVIVIKDRSPIFEMALVAGSDVGEKTYVDLLHDVGDNWLIVK